MPCARLLPSADVAHAQPLDKVTFATNWVAQAEHGGFYQALVDGTYKKHGLDVTILPGGPNVNHRLQLIAGRIEFYMSANTLQAFDAAAQNIPTLVVAAMFQKDPQVLLAHPDQGIEKFEDLKKLTLLISKEGVASYFQWMKHDFGFSEQQVKPYTFNPQPFLADKRTAMQGYVTSEPYAIETQGGFKPKIFLLADQGWGSYSTLIETRRDLVDEEARPGAALRRCLGDRLGELSLRRQCRGQRPHQARQSGDDRRAHRLFDRQDEGIRHRRFRRHHEGRHRRHDRRADEELLRQDGGVRRGQRRHRLQEGLQPTIRQQGRGCGVAAEVARIDGSRCRSTDDGGYGMLRDFWLCCSLCCCSRRLAADTYPSRPIRLLIPFPPAGITDLSGRIVAEALREKLKQPIIIENKPGANGVIGLKELLGRSRTATR